MPEGPSIVILKEEVRSCKGKVIIDASGSVRTFDPNMLIGKKIKAFKSWGKHFLICFPDFTLRIHFLLFGSYRINERKNALPRLQLKFKDDEVNFYACAIRKLDGQLNDIYDWTADVMNKNWDPAKAIKKLKAKPRTLICDALLDQDIFAGVGNIIKNEVLFRTYVHPKSIIEKIPPRVRKKIVDEAVNYSFDFLKWKKKFVLKKHWQAHTKRTCPRDHSKIKKEYLGKTNRRTFFCEECQKLYV
jgi:endonuclease VIII